MESIGVGWKQLATSRSVRLSDRHRRERRPQSVSAMQRLLEGTQSARLQKRNRRKPEHVRVELQPDRDVKLE